jgi:uncharacterized protein (TIGR03435 family)
MRPLLFFTLSWSLLAADKFDVVSIRPAAGGSPGIQGGPGTTSPEQMTWRGITRLGFVAQVFDLPRISQASIIKEKMGYPDSPFDISATVPAGTTKEEVKIMIRTMLEERFGMKWHLETQERTVYELRIAKGGLKLQLHPTDPNKSPSELIAGVQGRVENYTMADTVSLAQRVLNEPDIVVIDKTGLQGSFDAKLQFVLMEPTTGTSALPNFRTMLEQDWGLHLEKTKAPIEMVVIDHMDKTPTEN